MDILVSVLAIALALVAVIVMFMRKPQHRGRAAQESCPPAKDEVLLI
jgi:hypothetical protein